jgi:hypothetical protein
MVVITVVVTAIFPSVVVVAAARVIAAVIIVATLHVPGSATLGHDSRAIGAIDRDTAVAVELMVNAHVVAVLGDMHVADLAVGTLLYCVAILHCLRLGSLGHRSAVDADIGRVAASVAGLIA